MVDIKVLKAKLTADFEQFKKSLYHCMKKAGLFRMEK